MSNVAIHVEGLAKQYRLGGPRAAYGSLRESVYRAVKGVWRRGRRSAHEDQHLWALRDVSFDVEPGTILGIIGPNGAGKSTLLKILARVTPPTTGRVLGSGRVVSLLELGAGLDRKSTRLNSSHRL